MNYYIITGTSRGIGEAIARKLITAGNTIFAVSQELLSENLRDWVNRAKKRKKLCSSAECQDLISVLDGHLECRAALGAVDRHGADLLFQP